jgi:hypothetical protein
LNPTGKNPSVVLHTGASGPLTVIKNVLSLTSVAVFARTTNLLCVVFFISTGVPVSIPLAEFKITPTGNFPEITEYVIAVVEVADKGKFKGVRSLNVPRVPGGVFQVIDILCISK